MKALARIAILLAMIPLAGPAFSASSFPDHPIRLIVPYGPGGGTDILTRTLQELVSTSTGQQLIIDNRPGGRSIIGTEVVAKAKPDGYTLLATDSAILINPGLLKKMPFDTVKDLTGVTMMATAPVVLLVNPSVPAKSLQQLIELAKEKPGKLNFGSGGVGTAPDLAGELLKIVAKINITHVPYNGTGPALTALLGGEVQLLFGGISSAKSYVQSGRLRALAITGQKRNSALPDVPTFDEIGLHGINANSYWGVYAPAGTPPDIVHYLNEQFVSALHDPAVIKRLSGLGYTPIADTPEECTALMHKMINSWTKVVQQAHIQIK